MVTITPLPVLSNPDTTARQVIAEGTLVLSGNYGGGATNGDTLDLTQLGDAAKSSQLPTKVEVFEATPAGSAPSGYGFQFMPGTTQKNGLLAVLQGGAVISLPSAQITQGAAYPAGITAAPFVLRIRAYFPAY